MPRHPDPDLEERILKAADALWRRGGTKALTMRAVARAAGTNTPAVYRRFQDRQDLIRGILLRVGDRIRENFQRRQTLEQMADAYVQFALDNPNDYQLFYTEAGLLNPPNRRGAPLAPIRASRPNFGFVEEVAAKEMGGGHRKSRRNLHWRCGRSCTEHPCYCLPMGYRPVMRGRCVRRAGRA